jgi:hypothetical protein
MARKAKVKPSGTKQLSIEEAVQALKIGDDILKLYGPNELAGTVVWEVWVEDKDEELQTRFVEEAADGTKIVIESFQELAVRINIKYQDTLNQTRKAEWERQKEFYEIQSKSTLQSSDILARRTDQVGKLTLTGFGFVASILVAMYVVYTNSTYAGWAATYVFIAFIANAGRYLLGGKFDSFRIPNPFSK